MESAAWKTTSAIRKHLEFKGRKKYKRGGKQHCDLRPLNGIRIESLGITLLKKRTISPNEDGNDVAVVFFFCVGEQMMYLTVKRKLCYNLKIVLIILLVSNLRREERRGK